MSRAFFIFLTLTGLFFLVYRFESISKTPARFSAEKMTIDYDILIGDPLTSNQMHAIQTIIDQTFAEVDSIYNKWNPHSEVSYLNRLPAYQPVKISSALLRLLKQVDKFVWLSEGRFDPTIEPLAQLWKEKLNEGLIPSQEDLNDIKPCIGWNRIHLENDLFYKDDSRVQIDLGGIAKGLCVDLLVERLNQAGFQHVFVEWGGDIRASGQHPEGRSWNVYIRRFEDPRPSQAIAYLALKDQALATSGNYFQYWTITDHQGQEHVYGHIFNPLTLQPLEVKSDHIESASLLAPDCLTADSLAKILLFFDSTEELENWLDKLKAEVPNLSYWIAKREK